VAAAADGYWLLLGIGLLVSMPVIVYGSRVIIQLIARYPLVVTLGAALLGYLAGDMLLAEPLLAEPLAGLNPWLHEGLPFLFALGVVGIGKGIAARRTLPVRVVNEALERLEMDTCKEVAQ
jgi:predicted tellurium resistance membrane protein TerC